MTGVLTALRANSGTDVTGNFYGKAKDVALSAFQKASTDTVAALSSLTKNDAIIESNIRSLEGFICSMCNSKLKTVTDVRWNMLKRNPGMNMEILPPTSAALYQLILGAQYKYIVSD